MPGGDAIGTRPLDFHIAGLGKLGAELDHEHGYIVARAPRGLTGATVMLTLTLSTLGLPLAMLVLALSGPSPSSVFALLFAMIWFRSLYGSTVMRCGAAEPALASESC